MLSLSLDSVALATEGTARGKVKEVINTNRGSVIGSDFGFTPGKD